MVIICMYSHLNSIQNRRASAGSAHCLLYSQTESRANIMSGNAKVAFYKMKTGLNTLSTWYWYDRILIIK